MNQFSDAAVQDPQIRRLGECLHFVDDERFAIDAATVSVQRNIAAPADALWANEDEP